MPLTLPLIVACGPSDEEVQSMIDRAVVSALEQAAATSTSSTSPAPWTSTLDSTTSTTLSTDGAEYQRGFIFGYRTGYLDGISGELPQRLDDRDPKIARDLGYIEGYRTGHQEGSNAYFTDWNYGSIKAANLTDDQLFDRILESGDLGIVEPTWDEGRARGRSLGEFYLTEELAPIPVMELITGGLEFSTAEISNVSRYTTGFLLGYGEGLSGFLLDVAEAPDTDYERGTQLGFAYGSILLASGGDISSGLAQLGFNPAQMSDVAGFDAGFVSGYQLGIGDIPGD